MFYRKDVLALEHQDPIDGMQDESVFEPRKNEGGAASFEKVQKRSQETTKNAPERYPG